MVMFEFTVVGLAAAAIVLTVRSHRVMTLATLAHALSYFAFAALALSSPMPAHEMGGGFLIDHLAIFEMLITASIFALVAIYSSGYAESLIATKLLYRKNLNLFYAAMNMLLLIIMLCFCANDVALFWVLAELSTFFAAFLIAILNSQKNIYASLKYIFVTSAAMLFSFLGLIMLFGIAEGALDSGTLEWDALVGSAGSLPPEPLFAAFALMFIGFAAKAGIAPFHTVLPSAHSKAPSAVSAILSGVIPNIGIYGILRSFAIVKPTAAGGAASNLMIIFGLLSLAIAAFSMLKRKGLKKLLAFSTTENAGLVLIGIGVGTAPAVFWALCHCLAHSLTKAMLFFSAGIINRQYMSDKLGDIKDALKLQPVACAGLILGAAAIVGMPPAIVFVTEFSLLSQMAGHSAGLLAAVCLLLFIASVAFALFLSGMFSNVGGTVKKYKTPKRMSAPVIILLIAIFALGTVSFPQVYDLVGKAVAGLGFAP